MFKVVVGHSNDPDSLSAIDEIIEQCTSSLAGEIPKAGILVAAMDFDHALVLERINQEFPGIALIGGTTVGEMSSVLEFQEDSLALMLFCSDEIEIYAGVGRQVSLNAIAATQQAVEQALCNTKQAQLCLTIAEALGINGVSIVEGLGQALGQSVPIFGGLSSDDWKFQATYQFFKTEVLRDSVPILLFSGNLLVSCGAASGQYPVGRKGEVTKADGSIIYEIDEKPAFEFYRKYFGELNLVGGALGNALAVYEQDDRNYYLRAPNTCNPQNNSVTYFGSIPELATIQFTKTCHEDVLAAAEKALTNALDKYPGTEPIAALINSCSSRLKNLGTRTKEEYQIVKNCLGTLPIIGFYSFGEISPFEPKGQTYFHNETIIVLLLGTK